MAEPDTTAPSTSVISEVDMQLDGYFIGGMVCVALGIIFIIIAVIYLVMWCYRTRNEKLQEKRRRLHLQHMHYLEEYSIKAGDSPNGAIVHNNNPPTPGGDNVFKWESSDLVNMGYVSEDTLERLSQKNEGPKLEAHMNGSSSSYAQQRTSSHAGSMSSRPHSVASAAEVASTPSGGAREPVILNGKSDECVPVRSSRGDRLADVPV